MNAHNKVTFSDIASASAHHRHLFINQAPIVHSSLVNFISLIKRIDAAEVIVSSPVPGDLLEQINSIAPLVQCSEYNSETNFSYVSIDNHKVAQAATDFLISHNHNKIAFINDPLFYRYAKERREGYLDALAAVGRHQ